MIAFVLSYIARPTRDGERDHSFAFINGSNIGMLCVRFYVDTLTTPQISFYIPRGYSTTVAIPA